MKKYINLQDILDIQLSPDISSSNGGDCMLVKTYNRLYYTKTKLVFSGTHLIIENFEESEY